MAVIHRIPANTLAVETLTHTARWVTAKVEPEAITLDQTQRWQDESKGLIGHIGSAYPLSVGSIESTNRRLDLTTIASEVLNIDRDSLALVFHGHHGAPIVGLEVTHKIEATDLLVTLWHG